MKNLTLHPQTKRQLELVVDRQPQALVLHGKEGVGLRTVARGLALQLSDKHNVLEITPDDKGSIKIDIIRQLYSQTRTKRSKKLIVLIDNADAMLAPAQNALLKLLEDTPKNTIFLLTAHYPQLMLPTIRSRAQEIDMRPATNTQTLSFIRMNEALDKTKQPQILFLARGLPAELHRLTENQEYLEQRISEMKEAKTFLAMPLYEKLVYIYKLPSDRAAAFTLLRDIMRIIETTLRSRPDPAIAKLLEKLLKAEQRLHNDGHVRTQLLSLAVSIS